MRVKVDYVTRYEYDAPARLIQQVLRLTPRPHEGQHVCAWRLEIDADGRVRSGEDALGNLTHTLSVAGPIRRLAARVTGEVETFDTGGVVGGAVERFPPEVFLRETPLTHCDPALHAFAAEMAGASVTALGRLHALLEALHARVAFDTDPTDSGTSAAQAFAMKRGVCQDLSHIFIATTRAMGLPARYVSGHLARGDGEVDQEAAHAWCEVHIEDLGWVGFDAANGVCPTESYVRVAVGLDYLGAAPVRGSRYGGGGEQLDVKLRVTQADQ
ncbi:MAG: transglutaminase family protein [Caulobacteraceae bacterium]